MTPPDSPEPTHRPTIVGLGEVLWDIFPDGERFGGAAANFACAVAELAHDQASIYMASGVGADEFGQRAIEALAEHHVDATHVATVDQPTGTVTVELNRDASASYQFAADTAWDNIPWSDMLEQLAKRTDAVCFGTLGQRSTVSRRTIQQFLAAVPATSLRVLDVNLRPPFVSADVVVESLQIANVLKLSDEELPEVARMCDLKATTDVDMMRNVSRQFELAAIALTRGPEGAVLLRGDEGIVEAIRHLIADGAGLAVSFDHGVQFDRLDPKLEGAIFRIVQESLNNVKKHGQTDHAAVQLKQQNGMLDVVIRDHGVGFNPEKVQEDRFGLRGIRERARLFGGTAEIESAPDEGTIIRVQIPVLLVT